MNLQQLEYFKKVAETENFTTASNLLSVTQPALSKSISKLEEELNVPLFEKDGRNIKLTKYGKVFLSHTNIALLEIENGIEKLKSMKNPDTNAISISSTSGVGTYFMPFLISGFLNINPNVKFQFNYESINQIISDLKLRKIDLGFYECANIFNEHPEIEYLPIKKEEHVLIVPKNHKLANETEVSLKDLKDESFVAFCEYSKSKMMYYEEQLGYIPKVSICPSEASMLEGLVAAGAGISIVPNTPLINTNTLSIIKIKEKLEDKIIYMGWLKNSPISSIAKEFKDYVISSIS